MQDAHGQAKPKSPPFPLKPRLQAHKTLTEPLPAAAAAVVVPICVCDGFVESGGLLYLVQP